MVKVERSLKSREAWTSQKPRNRISLISRIPHEAAALRHAKSNLQLFEATRSSSVLKSWIEHLWTESPDSCTILSGVC